MLAHRGDAASGELDGTVWMAKPQTYPSRVLFGEGDSGHVSPSGEGTAALATAQLVRRLG